MLTWYILPLFFIHFGSFLAEWLRFTELFQALSKLYIGLTQAATNFASSQDYYASTFDQDDGDNKPTWLQEALNAIATAIGIGAALSDDPVAAAFAALANGISGGISTVLGNDGGDPSDGTVTGVADLESWVVSWEKVQDCLLTQGAELSALL
jgi:hypothetical protein